MNGALYQVTVEGAQPSATGLVVAPAAITYHYAANGLDVQKTFRFDSTYVVGIEAAVKRNGEPVRSLVEWPAALGDMEEFLPSSSTRSTIKTSATSYFAWALNGKTDSTIAKKVSGNATTDAPYSYAAVMDLYFAAAFLPDDPAGTTVMTLHNAIYVPKTLTDPNSEKIPADVVGVAVGDQSGDTHLRLFAGPKATDILKSVHAIGADGKADGQSLEPLIQFGFWTFIAKPLYIVLRFLVTHGIGNWGWAIILFTMAFTILLLPTRFMMMKSSLKMMRIQPRIEAIKKRYEHLKVNDPKRAEMNTEMMALYKTEGVNMYGGCLPLLVQMPLFFAYFRVLQNAVELRQAHWFWLTDLSNPDPLHILPVLIIITMFFTQYITPSPGMDPAQRRMMAFMMPMVFGFMLLTLRVWPVALLGHQQPDQPAAADRHQPVALRQGDARDCGQASGQKSRGKLKDHSGTAVARRRRCGQVRYGPAFWCIVQRMGTQTQASLSNSASGQGSGRALSPLAAVS